MAAVRSIAAVLGGVVVAGGAIALVEMAGHSSLQGGSVFGAAVVGYSLGALVGTAVATMVADRRTALAVPVILAALAAVNLFSFPHPRWFAPAAIVSLALGWWIGSLASSLGPRRGHQAGSGR